jgi:hypothetical protein
MWEFGGWMLRESELWLLVLALLNWILCPVTAPELIQIVMFVPVSFMTGWIGYWGCKRCMEDRDGTGS